MRARLDEPQRQKVAADERSTLAILTGAGLSKAFGYPLTGDLLPRLLKYLRTDKLRELEYQPDEIDLLRRGLTELLPGAAACPRGQLPLVTEVLSLMDHAQRMETSLIAGWSPREVQELRGLLEQVIADMVGPKQNQTNSDLLDRLAVWLRETSTTHKLGIITTNYDIELEDALFAHWGRDNVASSFDFGMSWREPAGDAGEIYPRPSNPAMTLLKLHGSLNWLKCPMCEYIYVNVNGVVVHWAWHPERHTHNTCHCSHWPLQSVLVAPSYVREMRDMNLLGIWRHALDFLVRADRWVLVGYSLPPEDFAIRTLLTKAYTIKSRAGQPPRIWVVQKGETERHRYALMFPNATFFAAGVEAFDFDAVVQQQLQGT